jgi:flagellar biosynthesis regulator FlaF
LSHLDARFYSRNYSWLWVGGRDI